MVTIYFSSGALNFGEDHSLGDGLQVEGDSSETIIVGDAKVAQDFLEKEGLFEFRDRSFVTPCRYSDDNGEFWSINILIGDEDAVYCDSTISFLRYGIAEPGTPTKPESSPKAEVPPAKSPPEIAPEERPTNTKKNDFDTLVRALAVSMLATDDVASKKGFDYANSLMGPMDEATIDKAKAKAYVLHGLLKAAMDSSKGSTLVTRQATSFTEPIVNKSPANEISGTSPNYVEPKVATDPNVSQEPKPPATKSQTEITPEQILAIPGVEITQLVAYQLAHFDAPGLHILHPDQLREVYDAFHSGPPDFDYVTFNKCQIAIFGTVGFRNLTPDELQEVHDEIKPRPKVLTVPDIHGVRSGPELSIPKLDKTTRKASDPKSVELEKTHDAIRKYASIEFDALTRRVINRLQRFPAVGLQGGGGNYKTLWDEFCNEVQYGPSDDEIVDAWNFDLSRFLDDVIERLPDHIPPLLSIYAAWFHDDQWEPESIGYVSHDALRAELNERLRNVAGERNLERFQT